MSGSCQISNFTRFTREMSDETLLYPAIEPFFSGHLKVSDLHSIYYEQCGNKNGLPIVFLHGGPGGGFSPRDRRFFDPKAYHAVLFDQRGAGKSTPAYCLEENDTWSLVEDIEKLRKHLNTERWVVFGGSWGATLALAYAEKHVERVLGLVLRGVFTLRKEEIDWFYQKGASFMFPEAWEQYLEPIPVVERSDLLSAYHKRLNGENQAEKVRCAKAYTTWQMTTSQLRPNPETLAMAADEKWSLALARIESHYLVNGGFMRPNQILEDAVSIVQGRYDVNCPPTTAWDLFKKIPTADFFIVDDCGHSAREVGITEKLVAVCDKYKSLKK
ncbi:proline iminopeptidase [Folsomia candida]|uniref:Proline iminopeptidase n=1 Tax=Folsomia candida TaxID=158441 RepID=A0A226DIV8_FOLCA|nr:proline iminopeptidase [Folsomia candida]OXA44511.1 Proline iminopeptidase [Folsomia candida]